MASHLGHFVRNFIIVAALAIVAACSSPQTMDAAPYATLVMDARSGEVLHAENADTRLHPASLTKMMTLYIAFEEIKRGNLSLDTVVTVSKHAAAQPPSKLGLKAGQKIALRYLIRAAAVKSANDAATAIGETISGSESKFAQRMTRTAKALGMKNTTFKNANGLTANGHLSTARDMTTMGRRLFYDFPEFYNIFSRRTADAGIAEVANTNRRFLDAYEGADGIKTGYTGPAGFNLTASAERGKKRIIATVMGGKSTAHRNTKMTELLDLGFGKAPNRAKVAVPDAPAYQGGDDLIADGVDKDLPEVEGGAGKTLRVLMAVVSSPRPKTRPTATVTPEVQLAMQDVVDPTEVAAALAEATAPPPPERTLEAQLAEIAEANVAPGTDTSVDVALEPVALAEGATAEAPVVIAALARAAPPKRPASAEAPAVAVANPTAAPEAAPEVVVAEVESEGVLPAFDIETIVAEVAAEDSTVEAGPIALAEVAPLAETADPDLAISEPVELAAVANLAPIRPAPRRNAPIFEAAKPRPAPRADAPEVVFAMSTSGGRHWGINVGRFNVRDAAERALVKTQLAESGVLRDGLRKIIQKGGAFDANFMGLTQEQADLACRRLQARAVQCFTMGP